MIDQTRIFQDPRVEIVTPRELRRLLIEDAQNIKSFEPLAPEPGKGFGKVRITFKTINWRLFMDRFKVPQRSRRIW
jgi:hypothetical protein